MSQNSNDEQRAEDEEISDPLSGLLIDFPDLLPGDILLFRWKEPDAIARMISAATGSPYTHAAIYLGGNEILEAGITGIEKRRLSEADKEQAVVGVLRSEMGFSGERPQELRNFADALIANDPGYDRRGVFKFKEVKTKLEEQLQFLFETQYGKVTPNEQLAQSQYFCSALVVACYIAVGIIGDTAQLAYQPAAFSPADLHEEPTFGWVVGYLAADRSDIPSDDPLLKATIWRDVPGRHWWRQES